MLYVDYVNLIRDIIINMTSLYLYAYGILYRRYHNNELFVSCCLFNVFLLFVVMAIVRTDFNMAIGFGLFALLSLVQVRSATFSKTEMAYFFGAVALAVINGCGIVDYIFVVLCNMVVVLTAWCISNWAIEHSADIMEATNTEELSVTLDEIDEDAINDSPAMIVKLSLLFKLPVVSFKIKKVDYVRDTIDLQLKYYLTGEPTAETSLHGAEEHVGYASRS